MKVLLTFFVLFLFPILISCNSYSGSSDKTVCVDTDALIRNGIIYLPNETKPFTGNNLCKYENGQIKSEGNYKDGKPDGKATYWHENGKIKGKVTFKDGKCISGDCL